LPHSVVKIHQKPGAASYVDTYWELIYLVDTQK